MSVRKLRAGREVDGEILPEGSVDIDREGLGVDSDWGLGVDDDGLGLRDLDVDVAFEGGLDRPSGGDGLSEEPPSTN